MKGCVSTFIFSSAALVGIIAISLAAEDFGALQLVGATIWLLTCVYGAHWLSQVRNRKLVQSIMQSEDLVATGSVYLFLNPVEAAIVRTAGHRYRIKIDDKRGTLDILSISSQLREISYESLELKGLLLETDKGTIFFFPHVGKEPSMRQKGPDQENIARQLIEKMVRDGVMLIAD